MNDTIGGAVKEEVVNGKVQTTPIGYSGPIGGAYTKSGIISQDGTTPIDVSTINSARPYSIPEIKTSTIAEGITGAVSAMAESTKAQQEIDRQAKETETAAGQSKSNLDSVMNEYLGVLGSQGKLEEEQKLGDKLQKATDVTNQIEASERAQTNELRSLEAQGLTDVQKAQRASEINRRYAFEQADLALIQSAANRDVTTAQSIVDRKIALQLEPLKVKLDYHKTLYENNREDFSKAQQNKLQGLIAREEREMDLANANSSLVSTWMGEVVKSGQPQLARELSALNPSSPTFQQDLGKVLAKIITKQKAEAPIVKTINGVDMQWDSATGEWKTIDAGAESFDSKEKSKSQLQFLRDTASKAKELSGASGASSIVKGFGDKFVGDSKFRQLEALTNTLKVNIMSLMTDPNVKKFFGPQMSNADVILMTSAGTTLNPDANSPAQMKGEIERLDELLGRMQGALSGGEVQDGQTKEWQGKTYKVVNGMWEEQIAQ